MPSLLSLASSKNNFSSPSLPLKFSRQLCSWHQCLLFSIFVKQGLLALLVQSLDEGRELREEPNWGGLFKLGAIGALVAGPLTFIDIMVYVLWPQPSTVTACFPYSMRAGLSDFLTLTFWA